MTYYGFPYDLGPTSLQHTPSLAELILEAFLEESELDCIVDQRLSEVQEWQTKCARTHWRNVLMLNQICKLWSAILLGNKILQQKCFDALQFYLCCLCTATMKLSVCQFDGNNMYVDNSAEQRAVFSFGRDCILNRAECVCFKPGVCAKIIVINRCNFLGRKTRLSAPAAPCELDLELDKFSFVVILNQKNCKLKISADLF